MPGQDFTIADPVLAATVKAFGWSALCRGDNPSADRARFIELYDQLAKDRRITTQVSRGALPPGVPALPPGPEDWTNGPRRDALIAGVAQKLHTCDGSADCPECQRG